MPGSAMDGEKKWWESRGVLGSLATMAIGIAAGVGLVTEDEAAALTDQTAELLLAFGALVSGAVSLWGRIAARRRLTL